MCYANASLYSEKHHQTYAEGYALSESGVIYPHAWCVDSHGRVNDPTWQDGNGLAYLGIPFSPTYIREHERRWGAAYLLHDAHLDNFRILRQGLPTSAVVLVGGANATTA